MLSDEQLEELLVRVQSVQARDIVGVLDEVVPYLIAEIRLSRAALLQQGVSFFGGSQSDRPEQGGSTIGVGQEGDHRGVRQGAEHQEGPLPVPAVPEEADSQGASRKQSDQTEGRKARRRPKPGRDRSIGTPYEGLLVTGGSGEQVGGESGEQVRAGGPLPVEAPSRLTGQLFPDHADKQVFQ
jgi:hypothetical protein